MSRKKRLIVWNKLKPERIRRIPGFTPQPTCMGVEHCEQARIQAGALPARAPPKKKKRKKKEREEEGREEESRKQYIK